MDHHCDIQKETSSFSRSKRESTLLWNYISNLLHHPSIIIAFISFRWSEKPSGQQNHGVRAMRKIVENGWFFEISAMWKKTNIANINHQTGLVQGLFRIIFMTFRWFYFNDDIYNEMDFVEELHTFAINETSCYNYWYISLWRHDTMLNDDNKCFCSPAGFVQIVQLIRPYYVTVHS